MEARPRIKFTRVSRGASSGNSPRMYLQLGDNVQTLSYFLALQEFSPEKLLSVDGGPVYCNSYWFSRDKPNQQIVRLEMHSTCDIDDGTIELSHSSRFDNVRYEFGYVKEGKFIPFEGDRRTKFIDEYIAALKAKGIECDRESVQAVYINQEKSKAVLSERAEKLFGKRDYYQCLYDAMPQELKKLYEINPDLPNKDRLQIERLVEDCLIKAFREEGVEIGEANHMLSPSPENPKIFATRFEIFKNREQVNYLDTDKEMLEAADRALEKLGMIQIHTNNRYRHNLYFLRSRFIISNYDNFFKYAAKLLLSPAVAKLSFSKINITNTSGEDRARIAIAAFRLLCNENVELVPKPPGSLELETKPHRISKIVSSPLWEKLIANQIIKTSPQVGEYITLSVLNLENLLQMLHNAVHKDENLLYATKKDKQRIGMWLQRYEWEPVEFKEEMSKVVTDKGTDAFVLSATASALPKIPVPPVVAAAAPPALVPKSAAKLASDDDVDDLDIDDLYGDSAPAESAKPKAVIQESKQQQATPPAALGAAPSARATDPKLFSAPSQQLDLKSLAVEDLFAIAESSDRTLASAVAAELNRRFR